MGSQDTTRGDLLGQLLDGRYRIESVLGEGGMGCAYLAHDDRLDRQVVVKVPREEFVAISEFRTRFAHEIRQLIKLEHRSIVKVHDGGEADGRPYMTLQYCAGGSLGDRLKEKGGRLTPTEVGEWLPNVADALDFIHQEGFLHRDIKPGNILFDKQGHVYVADFGIAKALGEATFTAVTLTGVIVGSPAFMAPEYGDETMGAAYDQYALAVAVYQALSCELPHAVTSGNPIALLLKKSKEAPRRLAPLAAHVPEQVLNAVMKAISTNPEERFASCTQFAMAFKEGLTAEELQPVQEPGREAIAYAPTVMLPREPEAAVLPQPEPVVSQPSFMFRSSRFRMWATAATAALVLGVGLVVLWPGGSAEQLSSRTAGMPSADTEPGSGTEPPPPEQSAAGGESPEPSPPPEEGDPPPEASELAPALPPVLPITGPPSYATKWGSEGSGDGQFRRPAEVAVDSSGNVYVVDFGNSRIPVFDRDGNFKTKWGSEGSGDGQFRYPVGVAVDSAGNVYVADQSNHRIQVFDRDGNFKTKWGSEGSGDGQFRVPRGVAVDSAGNVYVVDFGNSRIQKFTFRPAPTADLQAEANTIERGQSTTLSWQTGNATTVRLEPGIGPVDTEGSAAVSPASDTTYRLVAEGPGGTIEDTVLVEVRATAPLPVVGGFVARPSAIEEGQSTTLQWSTSNATEVHLNPGVGPVDPNGQIEVAPDSDTSYTLVATGPGGTAEDTVLVEVRARPTPVGGNIQPPTKLVHVNPDYPEPFRRARVEGIVALQAIIDVQGNVRDVKVLNGFGPESRGLNEAAIEAVQQWKYTPALLDGLPVEVVVTVNITFALQETTGIDVTTTAPTQTNLDFSTGA